MERAATFMNDEKHEFYLIMVVLVGCLLIQATVIIVAMDAVKIMEGIHAPLIE